MELKGAIRRTESIERNVTGREKERKERKLPGVTDSGLDSVLISKRKPGGWLMG